MDASLRETAVVDVIKMNDLMVKGKGIKIFSTNSEFHFSFCFYIVKTEKLFIYISLMKVRNLSLTSNSEKTSLRSQKKFLKFAIKYISDVYFVFPWVAKSNLKLESSGNH